MNGRITLLVCIYLFLCACVQVPVFKEDGYALINSNYPIVSLNGVEIEPAYNLDIEAGDTTLVIVYHSYQYNYICTFSWTAVTGVVYEVTDHDNNYPLTLYRWVRRNGLWAVRMDPLDPLQCTQEERR